MRQVNQKAANEMQVLLRTARTANAVTAGLNQIIKNYGVTEELVRDYGNGLALVDVLDKDGLLVGAYTREIAH